MVEPKSDCEDVIGDAEEPEGCPMLKGDPEHIVVDVEPPDNEGSEDQSMEWNDREHPNHGYKMSNRKTLEDNLVEIHEILFEEGEEDNIETDDKYGADFDDTDAVLDNIPDSDELELAIQSNIREAEFGHLHKNKGKRKRSSNKHEELPEEKAPEETSYTDIIEVYSNDNAVEGKNGFIWQTGRAVTAVEICAANIAHVRPGSTLSSRDAVEPLECFNLFFSENIIETILRHTNEEISDQRHKFKKSLDGTLQDLTKEELFALFGILFFSAALKDNHLSTEILFNPAYSGERYRACMSERRFKFLINCLKFDNKSTREERKEATKLAPISEIWEMLMVNCKSHYKVGPYLTIGEQLIGFRGNCPFRMYIPSKPNKYGLKLVMIYDSSTNYLLDAMPYLGKNTVPSDIPAPAYFVEQLSKTIENTNRNITLDNRFSSIPLAQKLSGLGLTCVGTIKKNTHEFPENFSDPKYKSRKIGSSMFLFHENVTALSYKAKGNRTELLISTMHRSPTFDPTGRPDIISVYNSTKGGVDIFDRMCQEFNCGRKTKRWPLCFFYNMLNIAGINAFVIYSHNCHRRNTGSPLSRQNFLLEIHNQMCKVWMATRLQNVFLNRELKTSIQKIIGFNEAKSFSNEQQYRIGQRKTCQFCDWKKRRMTKYYCPCGKPICGEHTNKLCPECFYNLEK